MTKFKTVYIKQEQTMHTILNFRSALVTHCFGAALIVLCLVFLGCGPKQASFESGEDAVNAFVNAMREDSMEELLKILGPDGEDLIWSGDDVNDQQIRDLFVKTYDEQHKLEAEGETMVLTIGKDDWPFPIPLVKEKEKWIFDTASGREEILNRRVGRNELDTIQVLLAIVDAEREYASRDRDGDGIRKYAQKLMSDPGKRNGLYWVTMEGEAPSPMGPLVAMARQEGYGEKKSSDKRSPYHGYFYRLLTRQGEHAEGGAFDYIVDEKMIGGFAVVAFPADYGNSGIMTFIVNHDGAVYQKNLGPDTEEEAKRMERFEPDETWTKVK
jgi:hypothetical protein